MPACLQAPCAAERESNLALLTTAYLNAVKQTVNYTAAIAFDGFNAMSAKEKQAEWLTYRMGKFDGALTYECYIAALKAQTLGA